MTFEYKPSGVCSRKYTFEMEGDVIKGCKIEGGCAGNLLGISKIITGMKAEDVIKAFQGTKCGMKPTSCPDQISRALKSYLEANA